MLERWQNCGRFYVTAMVSGFAVMVAEFAASRLFAPIFGDSTFVWANVIAVILLALAAGQFLGSRLADKHSLSSRLYDRLIMVAGVWLLVVPFAAKPLFDILGSSVGVGSFATIGSLIAMVVLFSAPLVFLGTVFPFTVRLLTHDAEHVGRITGRVSMLSTIGGLVGTFCTVFLLLPTLGTAKTILLAGFLLVVMANLGFNRWRRSAVIIVVCGTSLLAQPTTFAARAMLHEEHSPYGHIMIMESDDARYLFVDHLGALQARQDPNNLASHTSENYMAVVPSMLEKPKSALLLGHGAGTLTHALNRNYPELQLTGVEIDPAMTRVAREYFGLDEAKIDIVHADAGVYLRGDTQKYDLILMDCYRSSRLPSHLLTREFFEQVRAHLTPDGIFAIKATIYKGEMLTGLRNTLANVFGEVRGVQVLGSYNHVILGSDSAIFELRDVPEELMLRGQFVSIAMRPVERTPDGEVFEADRLGRIELLATQMDYEVLNMKSTRRYMHETQERFGVE